VCLFNIYGENADVKTPFDQPSPRVRLRSAVYVEENGQVLLVYDPVYRGGCWILPGGEVEFEETIVEATEREVFEETGLHVQVHSLWRFREIWEHDPDYPARVRKTLEFLVVGKFVSGEIDIEHNPSQKPDGKPRIEKCKWVALDGLGSSIEGRPVYPSELFYPQGPIKVTGLSLQGLMLPKLDLRLES
jgi:8-oxo-dGTP pyrophosphatase MutT (NUDIX family)